MSDFQKEIQKRIAESDPERLNNYITMFDRFLLYSLVSGVMSQEAINELVKNWEHAVKATIDTESQRRTNFLESTPQGRLAKKQQQPDGEDIRLLFLATLDTAKLIVNANLSGKPEGSDDPDGFGTIH